MSRCLFVASLAAALGSAAWNSTYPIDVNSIVESTSDASVFKNLGPCTCDMTFSLCDPGCSCDLDCSAEELALFSSVLPENPGQLNVKRCVDAASVDVNARSQLLYSFADNMLCVQDMNSPVEGVYFASPPDDITATMFDAYRIMKLFSFETLSSSSSVPSSIHYQTGSPIVAALVSASGSLYPLQSGFLPIPKPGLTSTCDDYNFALFQQSSKTSCSRFVNDLSTSCSLELDASLFSTKLRIGKTATATPDVVASYVSVAVSSVSYENRTTGFQSVLPSLIPSTYDIPTCTCKNAIKQVSYTLRYDKTGQIVSATADIVLSEAIPITSCSASPAAKIDQTYSASFIKDWDPSDTGRSKSGNPGYLVGYPVLAGPLLTVSGKKAIQQYINGLTVFGPSTSCSKSAHISVGFNESLQSSCLVSLQTSELQSVCQSGQIFDYLKIQSPFYIGQWGNSINTDISTWVQLDQETPPASFTWSSATRSCAGIVNSINFEFVTAALGSVSNPQAKILSARVRYGTTTWRMKTFADTQKQSFELKATATFVTIPDGGAVTVVPPMPPIFPRLPADILYPLEV